MTLGESAWLVNHTAVVIILFCRNQFGVGSGSRDCPGHMTPLLLAV